MAKTVSSKSKRLALATSFSVLLATASSAALAQSNGMFGQTAAAVGTTMSALAPIVSTVNGGPANVSLTSAEVEAAIARVVAEAQARNASATVAVTDRVGNVLAIYSMTGADATALVDAGRPLDSLPSGLAGLNVPSEAAAIAKAVTGSYLSSNGNAFSTRTANTIVQENFLPGSKFLEGGPLFGVQISQLPCSDLAVRRDSDNGGTIDASIGPKRSPLGLAADPGGLPLYKNGTHVGGIGVIADGVYSIDSNVRNRDQDLDELLAVAGTLTLEAPIDLRADRVTVDGRSLRFSDARTADLRTTAASGNSINLAATGNFVALPGYKIGTAAENGQSFGFGASGFLPDPDNIFRADTYVLTDAGGNNRFPPIAGTLLTQNEVTTLLDQAIGLALEMRAQIRRPLNSNVEVTISIVDTDGTILGIARTPDAPVFGTDVSLQKARTAALFTNPNARTLLQSRTELQQFVTAADRFYGRDVLDGSIAFSSRSVGNSSRPFYPDGSNGNPNGPFSVPIGLFSPFNTGMQVSISAPSILQHAAFIQGGGPDTPVGCLFGAPDANATVLGNGEQIFSGGVPLFRGNTYVGAIGVSGDGIDQDDTVAFLSADRTGKLLGTGLGNAPIAIRSDGLRPRGVTLRYIQCPYTPFLSSNEQNICQGL